MNTTSTGNAGARGSALIIAMAIVALLATISTVLLTEMSTRALHTAVALEDLKAFEAAEAGIDAALNDINSSPVYQPTMQSDSTTASRISSGELDYRGVLIESASTFGWKLLGPDSQLPITVHVSRKADASKPGCIGTSLWTPNDDIDKNGRPTWRSKNLPGSDSYCEGNIQPQNLGQVAFFTYAIDWFHDRVDNDGDGVIDDRNERNKYTIYSTGIHRGIQHSGVTDAGKVVTLEVNVQARDLDRRSFTPGPLEKQFRPRWGQ